jgi:glycosyltransferase involved in cell wall biosynthesis
MQIANWIAGMEPISLTLIVPTFNEQANLPACLESVKGWASEIFVVDSGSKDGTIDIAESYGARVVTHQFETHSRQWKWALENLPVSTDWVLALDADQRVTPELRQEISEVIQADDPAVKGAYVRRRQVFSGKWIRHGGYYPKYLLKLFRNGAARVDETDLVDHHFRVDGRVIKLKHDIIEDNRNERDITVWIDKHNRYAVLQAREELGTRSRSHAETARGRALGSPDERVLWAKRLWSTLPLYLRPLAFFTYRYFFRLGFLDGKQGFIFHFLQAFWYRLLVDIKLDELGCKEAQETQKPVEVVELER